MTEIIVSGAVGSLALGWALGFVIRAFRDFLNATV